MKAPTLANQKLSTLTTLVTLALILHACQADESVPTDTASDSSQTSESSGKSDADSSESATASDENSDAGNLPKETLKLFDELWANIDASDKIYCDCDSKAEVRSGNGQADDDAQYACFVKALALDPEGSKKALECDIGWTADELACLEAAGTCDKIETPPDDEPTCDEKALDALDACPYYPDDVEEALGDCYSYRARGGGRSKRLMRLRR